MKILIRILVFFVFTGIASANEKNEFSFIIGQKKEKIIESLFKTGDAKLLNEHIEATRYKLTSSPLGIIAHNYSYMFHNGELAQINHVVGEWVGPKEEYLTKKIIDKGNSENKAYFDKTIEEYQAIKIGKEDNTDVYAFEKKDYEGRIFVSYNRFISGQIIIWRNNVNPNLERITPDKFWFGLGNYRGVEQRIKETNDIPNKNGQTFIWSVKTRFVKETPVKLKVMFPSRPKDVPPSVEYISKENALIFQVGSYKEQITLEFDVNDDDPIGTYNMFLLADGTTIAGISYSVKN